MDKELKLSVKITSAVLDTFDGKVNVNCTVTLLEGGTFNDGSDTGIVLKRGDSHFATMYLDKTNAPGAAEGAETPYARTMRTIKHAGGSIRNGAIVGPFPNALIGVFDMSKTGKLRCHYLNTPLTAIAKAPPSRAMLAALFGEDDSAEESDPSKGTLPSSKDDNDIPF